MTRPARLSPGPCDGLWRLLFTAASGDVNHWMVSAETLERNLLATGLRLVALDGAEVVA